MTAVLVGTFKHQSPEWHAARVGGLGGSEIAAVVGLSPWESPFSLWHRKKGNVGRQTETREMSWGTRLEPVILDAFFETHPDLTRAELAGTYRHHARPWQRANLDALALHGDTTDGIVEAKTDRFGDAWGTPGTDQIPVYYKCQAQWYMDVMGAPRTYFAVLIGGSDYREYVLPYNEGDAKYLRGCGAAFIHSLRHDQEPGIDTAEATYQVVKQLPDGVTDTRVQIPQELADEYTLARADHAEAEARKRGCTSRILHLIGDGKYAETPEGVRVATRTVTSDGRTKSLMPAKEKK